MADQFDYIVVGGGTAGCLLSYQLAAAAPERSILLLERGGANSDVSLYNPYDKYTAPFREDVTEEKYTTPQRALDGRSLPYYVGRGLGGTGIINTMAWHYGCDADFDRWADCVGDQTWSWENVKQGFKKIESYHSNAPSSLQEFGMPVAEDHGHQGPIDISLPANEPEVATILNAGVEYGMRANKDVNLGNSIGIGICPQPTDLSRRVTSASPILRLPPRNLAVKTDSKVTKILFKNLKATAVQLSDGTKLHAHREIILSAGTVETAKLLLLSGVGPKAELERLGIEVVLDRPGIGKNFHDHNPTRISCLMAPSFSDRLAFQYDENRLNAGKEQWLHYQTGPMTFYQSSLALAFFKMPQIYQSREFELLSAESQAFIQKATVPHGKLALGATAGPDDYKPGDNTGTTMVILNHQIQSRGEILLKSSDPNDPAIIDFHYLDHPYDRMVMIEATREGMGYLRTPTLAKIFRGYVNGPQSESDEDIWEWVKKNAGTATHAVSTVKMGKPDDPMSCVDSKLRLLGLGNIRVADLSVAPHIVSGHTQALAFLLRHVAAEFILEQ